MTSSCLFSQKASEKRKQLGASERHHLLKADMRNRGGATERQILDNVRRVRLETNQL